MQFAILAALGIGAYLIFSSKPAAAATSPGVASSAAQQAAALQAFNDQAASLGLSPADAQNALALGLSPADYAARLGLTVPSQL